MPPLAKSIREQLQSFHKWTRETVAGWHLRYRARGLWRWLKEGRHWLGALGVLGLGWALPLLWAPTPEAHMRWTGAFLQVAGVGTVAYGLSKTRALFDKPPVWESLVEWLKRLPTVLRGPRTISGSAHLTMAPGSLSARGFVSSPSLSSDASLEDRIAALEEKHKELERQLHEVRGHIDERAQEIEDQLSEEQRAREAADERVNQRIEEASIGGLHLEVIGLVWLIVGILCASLPDEIAALLS